MPELADCLADFIATLGLDRPHVVGRSLGATLAIQLYDRHSAIPRGLVLAGAYAGRAGSLAPDVVEQRLRRLLEEMERPPSEWVPSYVPGLLTEAAPGDGRPRHSLMCDVRAGGNRVMLHATAEADLREVLPRIAVPTLLLHGDADARSPLHVADALHQQIPTSTVAVIPGVGHLGNTEAASRFNTRSEPSCASTRSCHCPDSTLGKGRATRAPFWRDRMPHPPVDLCGARRRRARTRSSDLAHARVGARFLCHPVHGVDLHRRPAARGR